jgi:S-adenosyl-L-methionine hydrolase (adenosine-forming)
MFSDSSIITLTTDFGYRDFYVSAMKAVILTINRDVRMIDVSHEVGPQDIMAGAWVTRNSAFLYPSGTIHIVVVDPTVGTMRKPVALRIRDQIFVGPDNGIFSLIADQEPYEAYELTNTSFWSNERSNTFHGRDIFAPVAAHLSKGVALEEMGVPLQELVSYRWALPVADNEGIQGWVMHVDRYGNLITNITREMIQAVSTKASVKIYVGNTILKQIVRTYADVAPGEPAALVGGSGHLEIAICNGNAERMLGAAKGTPISLVVRQ